MSGTGEGVHIRVAERLRDRIAVFRRRDRIIFAGEHQRRDVALDRLEGIVGQRFDLPDRADRRVVHEPQRRFGDRRIDVFNLWEFSAEFAANNRVAHAAH